MYIVIICISGKAHFKVKDKDVNKHIHFIRLRLKWYEGLHSEHYFKHKLENIFSRKFSCGFVSNIHIGIIIHLLRSIPLYIVFEIFTLLSFCILNVYSC